MKEQSASIEIQQVRSYLDLLSAMLKVYSGREVEEPTDTHRQAIEILGYSDDDARRSKIAELGFALLYCLRESSDQVANELSDVVSSFVADPNNGRLREIHRTIHGYPKIIDGLNEFLKTRKITVTTAQQVEDATKRKIENAIETHQREFQKLKRQRKSIEGELIEFRRLGLEVPEGFRAMVFSKVIEVEAKLAADEAISQRAKDGGDAKAAGNKSREEALTAIVEALKNDPQVNAIFKGGRTERAGKSIFHSFLAHGFKRELQPVTDLNDRERNRQLEFDAAIKPYLNIATELREGKRTRPTAMKFFHELKTMGETTIKKYNVVSTSENVVREAELIQKCISENLANPSNS